MTIRKSSLARARCETGVCKLTLIGVCIIFMTAAICKQMPAHAADAVAIVSLADLDLSTEKGMQTAHERLHATARRLCKEVINPWALSHHDQYLRCVDEAVAAAVGQIHDQALLAQARP